MHDKFQDKKSFHYEEELGQFFFQVDDGQSSGTFDKTRIKSLSEKPLFHKEFKVR